MLTIGIIGGTGIAGIVSGASTLRTYKTPYGKTRLWVCDWEHDSDARRIIFLPRHGLQGNIPPHRINYRANIHALKQMGCSAIFATAAAGSLRKEWETGSFVLVNQFIDLTKTRCGTFFENHPVQPVHVDVTQPYCLRLGELLKSVARDMSIPLADGATYVCTEGPRFETPAEIRMMSHWGGDLVGMTQVPEVVLAREAEICYAAVAIVTNLAAGIAESSLTHHEVLDAMERHLPLLSQMLLAAAREYRDEDCACRHALDAYREAGAV